MFFCLPGPNWTRSAGSVPPGSHPATTYRRLGPGSPIGGGRIQSLAGSSAVS